MNRKAIVMAATFFVLCGGSAAAADDRTRGDENRQEHARFDDHDQQVARDWYQQHRDHAPKGFRMQDRLSREEEARLQEGAVLDRKFRKHVYSAPRDLSSLLPPPPKNHRYVAIGGHVALIDHDYHVKSVIRLHDGK